jgi:WS/DGAT C-terminal domain/Wax ester synthase-like Acyl-CoA acyltransferase domain
MALIHGLEHGRWALAHKTHHCLVDGVGSVGVAYLLLDAEPTPGERPSPPAPPAHDDFVLSPFLPHPPQPLVQAVEAGPMPPEREGAMVPMNVRDASEHLALGNRISSLFVDLPVRKPGARARHQKIVAATGRLKSSGAAVGASTMIDLAALAPPVLHATLSRWLYATRLFNVTITNVPGPQIPLYAFGAQLRDRRRQRRRRSSHAGPSAHLRLGFRALSIGGRIRRWRDPDRWSRDPRAVRARTGVASVGGARRRCRDRVDQALPDPRRGGAAPRGRGAEGDHLGAGQGVRVSRRERSAGRELPRDLRS